MNHTRVWIHTGNARMHTHTPHTQTLERTGQNHRVWPPIRLFRRYSLLLSCVIGRVQMVAQNNTFESNTLSNVLRGSGQIPSNGPDLASRFPRAQSARYDARKKFNPNDTKKFKKYKTPVTVTRRHRENKVPLLIYDLKRDHREKLIVERANSGSR